VAENGDKFFIQSSTIAVRGSGASNFTSTTVGTITGGTGKFVGIRGPARLSVSANPATGENETRVEIEYWFAKRHSAIVYHTYVAENVAAMINRPRTSRSRSGCSRRGKACAMTRLPGGQFANQYSISTRVSFSPVAGLADTDNPAARTLAPWPGTVIVTSRRAALAELACAWRSPSSGLIVSY
jgi:hypothetical protein